MILGRVLVTVVSVLSLSVPLAQPASASDPIEYSWVVCPSGGLVGYDAMAPRDVTARADVDNGCAAPVVADVVLEARVSSGTWVVLAFERRLVEPGRGGVHRAEGSCPQGGADRLRTVLHLWEAAAGGSPGIYLASDLRAGPGCG